MVIGGLCWGHNLAVLQLRYVSTSTVLLNTHGQGCPLSISALDFLSPFHQKPGVAGILHHLTVFILLFRCVCNCPVGESRRLITGLYFLFTCRRIGGPSKVVALKRIWSKKRVESTSAGEFQHVSNDIFLFLRPSKYLLLYNGNDAFSFQRDSMEFPMNPSVGLPVPLMLLSPRTYRKLTFIPTFLFLSPDSPSPHFILLCYPLLFCRTSACGNVSGLSLEVSSFLFLYSFPMRCHHSRGHNLFC